MVVGGFFDLDFASKDQPHPVHVVGQGVVDALGLALAGEFGSSQRFKILKIPFVILVSQFFERCFKGIEQGVFDVAEGHRAMIALDADRGLGYFCFRYCSTGNTLQNDVFVNGDAIEHNFAEHGRFGFAALGIKLWRLKMDLQMLPQSRSKRGIDPRRVPFVIGFGGFDPTWINGACILVFGSARPPGVEQLNLITALQVNARIGTLW